MTLSRLFACPCPRVHVTCVGHMLIVQGRGSALRALRRYEDAAEELRSAAVDAVRLGWYLQAERMFYLSGSAAFAGEKHQLALDAWGALLPIAHEIGDLLAKGTALHNMGNVHVTLCEYEAARRRYSEALDAWRAAKFERGTASALHGLGSVASKLGENEAALQHFGKSLEFWRKSRDRRSIAASLYNVASVRSALGDYERALRDYSEALDLYRGTGSTHDVAQTHVALGDTQLKLGMPQKALDRSKRALEVAGGGREHTRQDASTPPGCQSARMAWRPRGCKANVREGDPACGGDLRSGPARFHVAGAWRSTSVPWRLHRGPGVLRQGTWHGARARGPAAHCGRTRERGRLEGDSGAVPSGPEVLRRSPRPPACGGQQAGRDDAGQQHRRHLHAHGEVRSRPEALHPCARAQRGSRRRSRACARPQEPWPAHVAPIEVRGGAGSPQQGTAHREIPRTQAPGDS